MKACCYAAFAAVLAASAVQVVSGGEREICRGEAPRVSPDGR